MTRTTRTVAFWIIVVFFVLSLVMLLMGQTMAVFNYDFAVQLGLQESVEDVGEFGVQINRAFGVGDTLIYIPLMTVSLVGLFMRKRWSLLTTAAVMGISAYWAITVVFMLVFLKGVAGYSLTPGLEYWVVVGIYIVIGIWGLFYLIFRGGRLIE
ncbi:MAG: hypothetical protein ACE5LU_06540 [Anaerolineae bacterium]